MRIANRSNVNKAGPGKSRCRRSVYLMELDDSRTRTTTKTLFVMLQLNQTSTELDFVVRFGLGYNSLYRNIPFTRIFKTLSVVYYL